MAATTAMHPLRLTGILALDPDTVDGKPIAKTEWVASALAGRDRMGSCVRAALSSPQPSVDFNRHSRHHRIHRRVCRHHRGLSNNLPRSALKRFQSGHFVLIQLRLGPLE
jgi:hypothetical protein